VAFPIDRGFVILSTAVGFPSLGPFSALDIVVVHCSGNGSLELEYFKGRLLNSGHAIVGT
jgi:hypothetical protein